MANFLKIPEDPDAISTNGEGPVTFCLQDPDLWVKYLNQYG